MRLGNSANGLSYVNVVEKLHKSTIFSPLISEKHIQRNPYIWQTSSIHFDI